jgi:hypothetical protein
MQVIGKFRIFRKFWGPLPGTKPRTDNILTEEREIGKYLRK